MTRLFKRAPVVPAGPCDWDRETFCTMPGCRMPATHRTLTGMIGDTPLYEMLCCSHAGLVGL